MKQVGGTGRVIRLSWYRLVSQCLVHILIKVRGLAKRLEEDMEWLQSALCAFTPLVNSRR